MVEAAAAAGGEPLIIVATAKDDQQAALSLDGRWIAYTCEEANGAFEVYVEPFMPGWTGAASKPASKAQWRVTLAGGTRPRWRADGRELYYLNLSGSLIAVEVVVEGETLRFESRSALFQINDDPLSADFDVSSDGQHFHLQDLDIPSARAISLVLNFQRLLESPRREPGFTPK